MGMFKEVHLTTVDLCSLMNSEMSIPKIVTYVSFLIPLVMFAIVGVIRKWIKKV